MSKSVSSSSRWIMVGLVALTLSATQVMAQTEVEANAQWGAPTYGTPIEYYVLQHAVNGGEWVTIASPVDTEYTLMVTEGDSHQIRVAGVDAEERQGPFTLSNSYIPGAEEGAPGQPGQPILF